MSKVSLGGLCGNCAGRLWIAAVQSCFARPREQGGAHWHGVMATDGFLL